MLAKFIVGMDATAPSWLVCRNSVGCASLPLTPLAPPSGQGLMPVSATSSAKTWLMRLPA